MRKHRIISIASFVTSLSLSIGLSISQAQMPPTLVQVATAKSVAIAPVQAVPATVYSVNQATLAAEVDGKIAQILQSGTRVNAGDIVAALDDREYQLVLNEAAANVSSELARLEYLNNEFDRLSKLSKSSNVSKTQLEQIRSDRNVSRQDIQAARAIRDRAKYNLERLQIKAPFDGVITQRIRRVGEWVSSGDDMISLANPDTVEIHAMANIGNLPYLSTGQSINIYSRGKTGTATIDSIVNVGDTQSGLYEIILIPAKAQWTAGETLKVSLPTQKNKQVLAVPRDALVIRRDGISVYRIIENKSDKVEVKTGVANDELIEVIGDIKDGDQVVIRGNERLRPGQDVAIKP